MIVVLKLLPRLAAARYACIYIRRVRRQPAQLNVYVRHILIEVAIRSSRRDNGTFRSPTIRDRHWRCSARDRTASIVPHHPPPSKTDNREYRDNHYSYFHCFLFCRMIPPPLFIATFPHSTLHASKGRHIPSARSHAQSDIFQPQLV